MVDDGARLPCRIHLQVTDKAYSFVYFFTVRPQNCGEQYRSIKNRLFKQNSYLFGKIKNFPFIENEPIEDYAR